jgi:outer membrane protein TolC
VGPNYTAPQLAVPSRFGPGQLSESAAKDHAKEGLGFSAHRLQPLANWWTSLHDPELNRLVRRAEEGNLSLAEAASRLAQSRAALRIAGAQSLPTLDATGAYARIETGRNGSFGRLF